MAKPLLVVLNLFLIFTYKIFFGDDVTVKQNIPDQVNAGESFTVEITIEKGDREGFAKWQQSLPKGFIASVKETAGATFSFKNQELKLIWMAIPKEESFTISYEIETDTEINGTFELSGQFSYIEDNQRKDLSSDIKSITITSGAQLASNTETEETEEPISTASEAVDKGSTIADKTTEPEESEEELSQPPIAQKKKDSTVAAAPAKFDIVTDANGIQIQRKIQPLEPAKYEVTLTIKKGKLNSFGKIEEYLPPNYTATLSEGSDAIFSFNRNVAKFLWMILPDQESIEIKYYMESTSDELDEGTLFGVFSYLIEDEPKQQQLKPSNFKNTYRKSMVEEPLLAEEPETTETNEEAVESIVPEADTVEEVADNTEVVPLVEPEEEIAEEQSITSSDEDEQAALVEEITEIPAPETAVAYKVQIAAGKREVNQQYFIDRHGIQENVNIEFHETWYKYTIGSFPVYKQARDRRNEIWDEENKIDDAFVTAYNSGERISVQEALMISQQKWYK